MHRNEINRMKCVEYSLITQNPGQVGYFYPECFNSTRKVVVSKKNSKEKNIQEQFNQRVY